MGSQRVIVRIAGTQRLLLEGGRAESRLDHTEQTAEGIYSFRNGTHFVVYDEDGGEGHRTRSTVKLFAGSFEVIKKGAARAHLVFRPGERSESLYDTPYGRLAVAFAVREVEVHLPGEDGPQALLSARAAYVLELEGEAAAECTVCVTAYEAGERDAT